MSKVDVKKLRWREQQRSKRKKNRGMGKKKHSSKSMGNMRELICSFCDLRDRCKYFRSGKAKFSIGDHQSTHRIPRSASPSERALYCVHRSKVPLDQ